MATDPTEEQRQAHLAEIARQAELVRQQEEQQEAQRQAHLAEVARQAELVRQQEAQRRNRN